MLSYPSDIAGLARTTLGHSDLTVRPVGLGCMGMSQFYGQADDDQSIATIRAALDLGVDFLDTSDIYGAADVTIGATIRGFGHNEQLIGKAISGMQTDAVIATKFGAKLSNEQTSMMIDGRRSMSSKPAKRASVGWGSKSSTCITAIAWIPTCPLRTPSVR